jgi:hypothetical protein
VKGKSTAFISNRDDHTLRMVRIVPY